MIPVNERATLAALEAAIGAVRSRIVRACERAGRRPEEVRLVGATKGVDAEVVGAAARAGLEEFGENYVQELMAKRQAAPDAIWHFIGRLQRNKVRRVLDHADVVQTLEPGSASERLIELAAGRPVACLVEVDLAGGRVGVPPERLEAFVDSVAERGVPLRGLMAVAPLGDDPRPAFARLRELRDALDDRFDGPGELSMGMSGDLEAAIEEGATMVRVGTAVFGPRARR